MITVADRHIIHERGAALGAGWASLEWSGTGGTAVHWARSSPSFDEQKAVRRLGVSETKIVDVQRPQARGGSMVVCDWPTSLARPRRAGQGKN